MFKATWLLTTEPGGTADPEIQTRGGVNLNTIKFHGKKLKARVDQPFRQCWLTTNRTPTFQIRLTSPIWKTSVKERTCAKWRDQKSKKKNAGTGKCVQAGDAWQIPCWARATVYRKLPVLAQRIRIHRKKKTFEKRKAIMGKNRVLKWFRLLWRVTGRKAGLCFAMKF